MQTQIETGEITRQGQRILTDSRTVRVVRFALLSEPSISLQADKSSRFAPADYDIVPILMFETCH